MNLFDNALQHDADSVHVSVTDNSDKISLVVGDNGKGISQGNKDKIFETFFTTKRADGGTGLGLGIVQSLLTTHNGDIRVLECDNGAKFEIKFLKF